MLLESDSDVIFSIPDPTYLLYGALFFIFFVFLSFELLILVFLSFFAYCRPLQRDKPHWKIGRSVFVCWPIEKLLNART